MHCPKLSSHQLSSVVISHVLLLVTIWQFLSFCRDYLLVFDTLQWLPLLVKSKRRCLSKQWSLSLDVYLKETHNNNLIYISYIVFIWLLSCCSCKIYGRGSWSSGWNVALTDSFYVISMTSTWQTGRQSPTCCQTGEVSSTATVTSTTERYKLEVFVGIINCFFFSIFCNVKAMVILFLIDN